MAHPLPVLPGVYYGTLEGEANGLPFGNVFCFASTNTAVPQPAAEERALAIATSLANAFGTHMLTEIHASYAGSTARVYALGYPSSPAQENHAANSGGHPGAPASVVTCALVKHVVHRRGKGSQARSYVGPLGADQVDAYERFMTPAAQTAMSSAFGAFISEVLTSYNATYPTETLSYVQLSRVGTGATYPITSSGAESPVAYQRRRARRRSA